MYILTNEPIPNNKYGAHSYTFTMGDCVVKKNNRDSAKALILKIGIENVQFDETSKEQMSLKKSVLKVMEKKPVSAAPAQPSPDVKPEPETAGETGSQPVETIVINHLQDKDGQEITVVSNS